VPEVLNIDDGAVPLSCWYRLPSAWMAFIDHSARS
jgi:hypothetical protein